MSAPVCDFVRRYTEKNTVRLHMPGHKGKPRLGFEPVDITEITGADELFCPDGIIAESEAQAGALFGARTLYSAGGSTLCIQTMLCLTARYAASKGERTRILAGRNAHRAFINAAALLDIDVCWLYPETTASYVSCPITARSVEEALLREKDITAVYITSPDYLGNMLDIAAIAEVCHRREVLLLVDNAHGAYLKFLPRSCHPMDMGATMCCDSAHKTLPVVTGGAYLHISHAAPPLLAQQAKTAMALFGSSSPSYLILQSLDAANDAMEDFRRELAAFLPKCAALKARLTQCGYVLTGDEPMKLTLCPGKYGYTGVQLAKTLEGKGLYPEFFDPDHVVLMLSPANTDKELARLEEVLRGIERQEPIREVPPSLPHPRRVLMPRQAILSDSELLPISECTGRISVQTAISCPPAIPLVVCGEEIDCQVVECLRYYGIDTCNVVK